MWIHYTPCWPTSSAPPSLLNLLSLDPPLPTSFYFPLSLLSLSSFSPSLSLSGSSSPCPPLAPPSPSPLSFLSHFSSSSFYSPPLLLLLSGNHDYCQQWNINSGYTQELRLQLKFQNCNMIPNSNTSILPSNGQCTTGEFNCKLDVMQHISGEHWSRVICFWRVDLFVLLRLTCFFFTKSILQTLSRTLQHSSNHIYLQDYHTAVRSNEQSLPKQV